MHWFFLIWHTVVITGERRLLFIYIGCMYFRGNKIPWNATDYVAIQGLHFKTYFARAMYLFHTLFGFVKFDKKHTFCHYRKSNNVLWLGLAPDVFPYLSGLLHWRRDNRTMGLLPDTWNCRLHMRQEYRELFPRHQCEMKLRVSDPTKHHGRCVMHVLWCMSGLLTRGGGENVPGIPGACTTRNFTYLARCPWPECRGSGGWINHIDPQK